MDKEEWLNNIIKEIEDLPIIPLKDILNRKKCGKNSDYCKSAIILTYNKKGKLLTTWPLINQGEQKNSLFRYVFYHLPCHDFRYGWHYEIRYAKFYAPKDNGPMDLIMLSNDLNKKLQPKYLSKASGVKKER